jgi:hypothetical protein
MLGRPTPGTSTGQVSVTVARDHGQPCGPATVDANSKLPTKVELHPRLLPSPTSQALPQSQTFKMDTLVAQYSRPMLEKENFSDDDQMKLYQADPILTLRFAMPPVAQVSVRPSMPKQLRATQFIGISCDAC